jgi:hypothetical protein
VPLQAVAPPEQVRQFVPEQAPLVQVMVAGVVQVPLALHVAAPWRTPAEQDCAAPQDVPAAAGEHAPAPLQVPDLHVEPAQALSAAPVDFGLQVPALFPRLHAWQVEQLEVEQQTPSTQFFEAHSAPVAHARPMGLVARHLPALQ